MLKGKVIKQDVVNANDTSAPTSTILAPSKSIKNTSEGCQSVKVIPTEPHTSATTSITSVGLSTPIVNLSNGPTEYIVKQKNLRYSVDTLKQHIPGYTNLHYTELFDTLMTLDGELTPININLNLQKLINLGNNAQSHISRLNSLLNVIPTHSLKLIKEQTNNKIGFFTTNDTYISLFGSFNTTAQQHYNEVQKSIDNISRLQTFDIKKCDLVYLYLNFFKFIHTEVSNNNIADAETIEHSILINRITSLHNSTLVLDQFKQLLEIELQARQIELNNCKEYLDILKPSLYLLQQQNFGDFKKQFKQLLEK